MTREIRLLIVYLFGIQPLLLAIMLEKGYTIPQSLLQLGMASITILTSFFLLWRGIGHLSARRTTKNEQTEVHDVVVGPTAWQSVFRFFQKYIIGPTLYVGTVLLVAYPFALYDRRILVGTMAVIIVVGGGGALLCKGSVYVYRRLLVARDVAVIVSTWVWAGIVWMLAASPRYVSFGAASVAAFLFLWLVVKGGGLVKRYSVRRLFLGKLYMLLTITSLVFGGILMYRQTDGLLTASFTDKIVFMRENLQTSIDKIDIGTWKIGESKIEETNKTEIQDFPLTGVSVQSGNEYITGQHKVASGVITHVSTAPQTGAQVISGISAATGAVKQTSGSLQSDIAVGLMTYRTILKHLFTSAQLTKQPVSFSFISRTDPDYWYFATAHIRHLLGKNIRPDAYVYCDTYMVMKGMRYGRKVVITNPKDPFTPYRNKAVQLGQLHGCQKGKIVKTNTL